MKIKWRERDRLPVKGVEKGKIICRGHPREHLKGTSGRVTSSFKGSPTGDVS
jgi:hypothetical protein